MPVRGGCQKYLILVEVAEKDAIVQLISYQRVPSYSCDVAAYDSHHFTHKTLHESTQTPALKKKSDLV